MTGFNQPEDSAHQWVPNQYIAVLSQKLQASKYRNCLWYGRPGDHDFCSAYKHVVVVHPNVYKLYNVQTSVFSSDG